MLRMEIAMWRRIALLVILAQCVTATSVTYQFDYEVPHTDNNIPDDVETYTSSEKEYIRHIHSMVDAYREGGARLVIETNALIDTKYRTWKRNADLINSLLALPKGMDDAGR